MECIECGEHEGQEKGLCEQCYLKHYAHMDVPAYVDLVLCPHCGALKRGEHWLNMEEPEMAIDLEVKNKLSFSKEVSGVDIRLEIGEETPYIYEVDIFADLHSKGMTAKREGRTIARLVGRVCDVCSRLHGNYYESIVQLRGYSSKLPQTEREDWMQFAKDLIGNMSKSNRQVFLSKTVDMHGGLDFYLSTTDAGRILARDLTRKTGAAQKESSSIAGRKDGRDIYRTTFSVRLPPFKQHDYLILDDKVYRVEKVTKDRVDLLLLRTGDVVKKKRDIDEKGKRIGGDEVMLEAVVVYDGGEEIQVMDPVSYKTVTLCKPTHYEGDETVCVIRYEEEIYIA